MLTPRFLQRITEATEDKTAKLNKYLTQKIIDRILHVYEKTGEVNVNTAALFDALKQQESGRLFDEVVEEIAKKLPEIQDEVRKAFYDSAGKISKDMYLFAQEIVELEDIPDVQLPKVSDWEKIGIPKKAKDLNLTPKEIRLLEAAYKRTNGEIYNITRTTAQASEQTFINACDSAWWKVTHGVSRDEAIMEAIDEVAEKGITTVHYANREEKIEVAIARAVKTGVNQANGDITLTRCAEMGVGYVIVNEHLGARVTKYEDYTNHAHWQGKTYKLNWDNPVLAKYQPTPQETKENAKSHGFLGKIKDFLTGVSKTKDEKYKDFIEVCGYGKMLGICGINCRHSFNPFYPGININTNKGIDSQENAQRYANEQKQRAMERNMRDIKRREEALAYAEKQTDNEEITKRRKELQEKLEKKREEYVDFCAENKLTRESHRLQIAKKYGVSNEKAKVRILNEYSTKNGKYIVDGKKVLADYKEHDREIAELMCDVLDMDVCLVPRVIEPQGISTPDYLIGGKRYDLKEPIGNSKNTLYNMINKKKDQADNFIFDISKCPLGIEEINRQIEDNILKSKHTEFVQSVILVKDMKILKIYIRK